MHADLSTVGYAATASDVTYALGIARFFYDSSRSLIRGLDIRLNPARTTVTRNRVGTMASLTDVRVDP
jgi:hypothetical protein